MRTAVDVQCLAAPAVAKEQAGKNSVCSAKSHGRAHVRTFTGELAERAEERLHLSEELREALEHDQLSLVFQPIMDVDSGDVLGVEALARWHHPLRGTVPPDVFVTVAEETGLARCLDDWVTRHALAQMAELRRTDAVADEVYLAVNVTAASVSDDTFPNVVRRALSDAALPPSVLVVELTETCMMADLDAAILTLTVLRELGVGVAIDDFGTGWSSLSYLRRLPANILKIDRSFVSRLHEDHQDRAIFTAIVHLARATGMTVVAEGVETMAQLEVLRQLRCASGQGHLWHDGVPASGVAQAVWKAEQVSRSAPRPRAPVSQEHGLDRLHELHAQGASRNSIASALNREGYRTPTRQRWHAKTVDDLLRGAAGEASQSALRTEASNRDLAPVRTPPRPAA